MTTLLNRIILVNDHKTSMRLTTYEWYILDRICIRENLKRGQLFELIDTKRSNNFGFTQTVHLFSLLYLHNLARRDQNYSYAPDDTTLTETLKEMSI